MKQINGVSTSQRPLCCGGGSSPVRTRVVGNAGMGDAPTPKARLIFDQEPPHRCGTKAAECYAEHCHEPTSSCR